MYSRASLPVGSKFHHLASIVVVFQGSNSFIVRPTKPMLPTYIPGACCSISLNTTLDAMLRFDAANSSHTSDLQAPHFTPTYVPSP
jgi:hypothetical protein